MIGFAASSVLPARAGEVMRPLSAGASRGLSATATFATIIVERILDLVAVLILLATYLIVFDTGMAARDSALFSAIRLGGLVMAPVAVTALVVMFVLAGHPSWLHAWLARADRCCRRGCRRCSARIARMFAEGFGVLRRPERLVASMGWSLVLWLVICWRRGRWPGVWHRHAVCRVVADAGAARGGRRRADARRRRRVPRSVPPRRDGVLRAPTTTQQSARRSCCMPRRSCRSTVLGLWFAAQTG